MLHEPFGRLGVVAVSKWVQQLRIQHWVKNLLIFTPLITNHSIFELDKVTLAIGGFFIFSMCSSATYLINDILDVESDRLHHIKKHRPVAAGTVKTSHAAFASIILFILSSCASALLIPRLLPVLIVYSVITLSYSLYLKKKPTLDVIVIGMLFVIRIFAGGVSTDIPLSHWLLSFSGLFFLSIAYSKRYLELTHLIQNEKEKNLRRGYELNDSAVLLNLGVSTGVSSITIFILYINDPQTQLLYLHKERLLLLVPILTYWVASNWSSVVREKIEEDPVKLFLSDKRTLFAAALALLVIVYAR
jgi:4-hydroxybenzoate polyprenyltransferase